jgi:hypothetical protein
MFTATVGHRTKRDGRNARHFKRAQTRKKLESLTTLWFNAFMDFLKKHYRHFAIVTGGGTLLASLFLLGCYQTPLAAPAIVTAASGIPATNVVPVSFYETSSTSKEISILGVTDQQYKRIDLSDVKNYNSTSVNNYVVTSGVVVGVQLTPYHELVLSDGKGSYLMVAVGGAAESTFGPIYSNLRIGNTVEVKGVAESVRGFPVSSATGVTISSEGNMANALQLGSLNLTGIKKIK